MRAEFLCIFVLRITSGPKVKFVDSSLRYRSFLGGGPGVILSLCGFGVFTTFFFFFFF